MSLRSLAIVGGGGHAREVLDVITDLAAAGTELRVTGLYAEPGQTSDSARRLLEQRDHALTERLPLRDDAEYYVVALGNPDLRRRLAGIADEAGLTAHSLVSPHAVCRSNVEPAYGIVIFPMTYVSSNVTIGRHVILNTGCSVSHDSRLQDFVTLSPGCIITGAARIGRGAFLGAGAVILPRITVGRESTVGAGAVVTTDVPDGATVAGVPARVVKRAR